LPRPLRWVPLITQQALGFDERRAAELEAARELAATQARSSKEQAERLAAQLAGLDFSYRWAYGWCRRSAICGALALCRA
jgi:hypothetical protein